MYILSQIVSFISLILTLISYHLDTKKKIFNMMCIANFFDMCHYLCLNAYSGCLTKVIALVRNIFIIKKEQNKKLDKIIFLIIFLVMYLIVGVCTFKNIFSILPLCAAIIYMIITWNGNTIQTKKVAFYCYFLWLAYNICILSIVGIISNIILLCSTFIAFQNSIKINKIGLVNNNDNK